MAMAGRNTLPSNRENSRATFHPVSYTHLDVYKRQDSGRAAFSSAAAGIRAVASSLAHSALYRNKDVDGVLKTYNGSAGYARRVKDVMRRIAPAVD